MSNDSLALRQRSGFFAHHGAWAPGVRLFRSLGFSAKAALLSLCFLIPLAVVTVAWFKIQSDNIAFSQKERLGVTAVRAAMPLQQALMKRRVLAEQAAATGQAPAELAALDVELPRLLQKLEAEAVPAGDPMGVGSAVASLKAQVAGLAGGDVDRHSAAVDATIALITSISDGSNLTLDPDVDSYYLMDAAVFRVPGLLNDISVLRGVASSLASGAPHTPERHDAMVRAEFNSSRLDGDMNGGLAKVEALHPGTIAALGYAPAARAMRDFYATAQAKADAGKIGREGAQVIESMLTAQSLMLDRLDELLKIRVAGMRTNQVTVAAVIAVTLTLAAYLFYSFYLVMSGGLQEVTRHLRAMTGGDLTTSPSPWGKDEAAQLMRSLSEMQASLRAIVREVRKGSDGILHASSEIANGATDLSSRTEQTAANLQQTAASMEEISGTVKNTAAHAEEAAGLSRTNAEAATEGGQVMTQMVRTMDGIGQSSARIGEIIGVIDGIAFQTNILALNAAVEAARAGEQGRGFAVVASEVRSLAQRSASAAKEIKRLIGESQSKVARGSDLATRAGSAIGEVVEHVRRVSTLIAEISHATDEQSAGIARIGDAVSELDRVTQQNAALVEQSAAASESLDNQAGQLIESVRIFRIESPVTV